MKTYNIHVCFDSRPSQSGWISVYRRNKRATDTVRFNSSVELSERFESIKHYMIVHHKATHFNVSVL